MDIKISIESETRPHKLILQPEGKEISFEYRDGRVYFEIARMNMHNIIEVLK